jgi:metallo-beta-lactamase class B
VLIDGTLAMSAPQIMANIRALGFRVEDIKVILNSHAHFDHAGGIAAIQRASDAQVAASAWSAATLERGMSDSADPQFAIDLPFPAVPSVRVIADGETIRVGALALTAHFTPGHTPGGTSWTWVSCEHDRCLNMLYADSQTAVSADDFLFTNSSTYPAAVKDFEHGLATLARLPCDILMTTHPDASNLIERLAARDSGTVADLRDPALCKDYVARSRAAVLSRFERERAKP